MIVTVIQMVVAINMGNTYFNQCLNYAYSMPGTSLKAPCMLSDLILKPHSFAVGITTIAV